MTAAKEKSQTRALRDRSLLALLGRCRGLSQERILEKFPFPFLLSGTIGDPASYAWTIAIEVRKKHGDELVDLSESSSKLVEISPRLKEILLNPEQVYVGRSPSNDITLAPRSVSRIHACFFERDSKWLLNDLASANGTMVGGQMLSEGKATALSSFSKINFGPDSSFVFVLPIDLVGFLDRLNETNVAADTSEQIRLPSFDHKTDRSTSTVTDLVPKVKLEAVPLKPSADFETALCAVDNMFTLLNSVTVVLSIRDQELVVYEASSTKSVSTANDLRQVLRRFDGLLGSIAVKLSVGDGSSVQVYVREGQPV